jgi:polysaccharide deactylase WbmS-like protein
MKICLTIDIDWAPDFVIAWMWERIQQNNISATWFVTHDSPVLNQIDADPDQEIGLHPNFFADSTQGNDKEAVMKYLTSYFHHCIGVRAHAFLDSTRHQWLYQKMGMKYISNLIIWNQASKPYFIPWADLWQIPISWEDDRACFFSGNNQISYPNFSKDDSTWVLNFHPLYCYLNDTTGMPGYKECRDLLNEKNIKLYEMLEKSLIPVRQKGNGLSHGFDKILKMSDRYEFLTLKSFLLKLNNFKNMPNEFHSI